MAPLDFSKFGEPINGPSDDESDDKPDFSGGGELMDFSSFGEPIDKKPGFLSTIGQAGMRGIKEGFSETADVAHPFTDRAAQAPDASYVGKLLDKPVTEGWSDPSWWAAHIAYGGAKAAPSYALAAAGAAAGAATPLPGGALIGGAAGFGVGSVIQTLAPAYQKARQEGLNHDDAVTRAMEQAGIAGAFAAAMGAAPGLSIFGKTAGTALIGPALKRPISEALAQIFGVQPGIGAAQQTATAATEGRLPTAAELGTGYAENVGLGAVVTGAHAGLRHVTAEHPVPPPGGPGTQPAADAHPVPPGGAQRAPEPAPAAREQPFQTGYDDLDTNSFGVRGPEGNFVKTGFETSEAADAAAREMSGAPKTEAAREAPEAERPVAETEPPPEAEAVPPEDAAETPTEPVGQTDPERAYADMAVREAAAHHGVELTPQQATAARGLVVNGHDSMEAVRRLAGLPEPAKPAPPLGDVIEDIKSGRVKARAGDVAVAYGIPESAAHQMLYDISRRPDTPIAMAAGAFEKRADGSRSTRANNDLTKMRWRRAKSSDIDARMHENDLFAEREFGLVREDFPNDAAFMDELRARMDERARDAEHDALEREALQYEDEYGDHPETAEDIPFDEAEPAPNRPVGETPAAGREPAGEAAGTPAADIDAGRGADTRAAEPRTDLTPEGEQFVLPGAERSARQAAEARPERLRGTGEQRAADDGLFGTPKAEEPGLPLGEPHELHDGAEDVIRAGKEDGNEHVSAVDAKTGKRLFFEKGIEKNAIVPSHEAARSLRDPNNRIVVQHNHPAGMPLGSNDVRSLAQAGEQWVVAHGADGSLSAARLEPEAAQTLYRRGWQTAEQLINRIFMATQDAVRQTISRLVSDGKLADPEATRLHYELVNRALDRAGLTKYVSTHGVEGIPDEIYLDTMRRATNNASSQSRALGLRLKEKENVALRGDTTFAVRRDVGMDEISREIAGHDATDNLGAGRDPGRNPHDQSDAEGGRRTSGEDGEPPSGLAEPSPDAPSERHALMRAVADQMGWKGSIDHNVIAAAARNAKTPAEKRAIGSVAAIMHTMAKAPAHIVPPPPKGPPPAASAAGAAPPQGPRGPAVTSAREGSLSRPASLTDPRELEDQLHQLAGNTRADAIEAQQFVKSLPPDMTPSVIEKLYAYAESKMNRPIAGAPKAVHLTPREQELFDTYIKPIQRERDALARKLEKYTGKSADDWLTPRYAKERTRSYGEMIAQWQKNVNQFIGGPNSRSMRRTVDTQKSRRFYMVADPSTGEKMVVAIARNGNVLGFDGSQKPYEVGKFPNGQPIKPGSKVTMKTTAHDLVGERGGTKQLILEQATSEEITQASGQQYVKNIVANELDARAKLQAAVRNAEMIDSMIKSPEWADVAEEVGEHAVTRETDGRRWRVPELAQFRKWAVEPKIADALDDFSHDMGTLEGVQKAMNNVGRFLNAVMFINPKYHIDNVFSHMMVERGLIGNIMGLPSTIPNVIRALREVATGGKDYVRALRAGAALPYSRYLSGDLHMQLLTTLGGEAERAPKAWDRLARAAGYPDGKFMVKRLAMTPTRVLWSSQDAMVMFRLYEEQAKGRGLETAFKELDKGLPPYRIPGQVMGSRGLAQVFNNPIVGRFGRYQYGRLAAYFHMLRDAFGPDRSTGERARSFDRMAMLGVYMLAIYPMYDWAWKKLTGNSFAETVRSGATSIPHALVKIAEGKKAFGDIMQSVFTPGLALQLPGEIMSGRYSFSGQPIIRDADIRAGRIKQVLYDAGTYIARQLSTVGQLISPSTSSETAGQIGLRALGVLTPTSQQVHAREMFMRRESTAAANRAAKEVGKRLRQ